MGRTIHTVEIIQRAGPLICELETTTDKKGPKDMKSVGPNSSSNLFYRPTSEYIFHSKDKSI